MGAVLLESVIATEFLRLASQGRTAPIVLMCENAAGDTVEVFCKLSKGCDAGVSSLAREGIGACLAADLGLPVPSAFLVHLSPEFIESVPDNALRERLGESSPVAFGSLRVSNQFATWAKGNVLTDIMVPNAIGILVFDAIIQNPDRREGNANCLVKGSELRIFDHELAFMTAAIIGWTPPWKLGGLNWVSAPGSHIFFSGLRGRDIDYDLVKDRWVNLSDAVVADYQAAIPGEWAAADAAVQEALKLIRDARDNADGCLDEVRRILK